MNRMFGYGIIGAGGIAHKHAQALAGLGGRARLIAAADPSRRALRRLSLSHFVPLVYEDHRRLLERRDVDVVIVATPPSSHEALVRDALEAGKHVVCEKPLAHTLAAADRMIEFARRYPGRVTVNHQQRYLSEFARLIWLRDEGVLGEVRRCHVEWEHYEIPPTPWWGRWSVSGGGMVITQFIHRLDLLVRLLGRPIEVEAWMDTLRQPIESEDTFEARVRFEGGAEATCRGTVAGERYLTQFDVEGAGARVALEPWSLELADRSGQGAVEGRLRERFAEPGAPRKPPLLRRAIRRLVRKLGIGGGKAKQPARGAKAARSEQIQYHAVFLDAIESGGDVAVPVSPEDSRAALELCAAIYASAMAGEPVTLPIDATRGSYGGLTAEAYATRRARRRAETGEAELRKEYA